MILVVKNADFSAVCIEKVDFQTELDPTVVGFLSKYTKYPANKTNAYAQALNKLYNSLVSEGLWSKIKVLSVPVMAKTVQECYNNLADGGSNFVEIDGPLFGLNQSNEIVRIRKIETSDTTGGYPITQNSNGLSFFGTINPNGSTKGDIMGASDAGYFYAKNTYLYTDAPIGQVYENSVAVGVSGGSAPFLPGLRIVKTPFVLSYDGSNVHYIDNRIVQEGAPVSVAEQLSLTRMYPLTVTTNEPTNTSMKIFGCGVNLSSIECETLYNIIDEFDKNTTV